MECKVKFVSKDNQWVVITITTENYVSFTGECGGCYGQCEDEFVPTDSQQKLVDFWKSHHLKGVLSDEEEKELLSIIHSIAKEEADRKKVSNKEGGDYWVSNLTKKEKALYEFLQLERGDAQHIEDLGNCEFGIFGQIYFVGTRRELEKIAKERLTEESDLWQQAVANGDTELGLDDWADEVLESDGVGSVLSYYDGVEYEWGKYIICREQ